MNKFINLMNSLPKIVKILLALPVLDLIWVVYRICKSAVSKNTFGIIIGVLLFIIGWPILWLIDMITLIAKNNVLWFE